MYSLFSLTWPLKFELPIAVSCGSGAFWCSNHQCINSSNHCDGTRDCTDGSDEIGCGKLCLILENRTIDNASYFATLTLVATNNHLRYMNSDVVILPDNYGKVIINNKTPSISCENVGSYIIHSRLIEATAPQLLKF